MTLVREGLPDKNRTNLEALFWSLQEILSQKQGSKSKNTPDEVEETGAPRRKEEDAPVLTSCHHSSVAKDSGKKRGLRVVFEPYSVGWARSCCSRRTVRGRRPRQLVSLEFGNLGLRTKS